MKNPPKNLGRSARPAPLATAEQLHAVSAAITALNAALAPILQPLTEGELRDLLRVGIGNEAFTRDYVSLITAHPDLMPGYLHVAETRAEWEARDAFAALGQAVAQIGLKIGDTVKALQSDCYADALSGYRVLVKGGVPAGFETAVAPLREHMAQRQARRSATRAKNLALKAARPQSPTSAGGSTTVGHGATTGAAATVIPMSATNGAASAAPRSGNGAAALAA